MINIVLSANESDNMSVNSGRSNPLYASHTLADSKTSITSSNMYSGQLSATESSREDDRRDDTESDKSSLGSEYQVVYILLMIHIQKHPSVLI